MATCGNALLLNAIAFNRPRTEP